MLYQQRFAEIKLSASRYRGPSDHDDCVRDIKFLLDEIGRLTHMMELKQTDVQATVEALQAIIKQMGEQACVLAKDGMAAKAQVEALQRERDEAKASRDMWKREAYLIGDALRPLCGLSEYEFGWKPAVKIIADKLAALDAEREKVAKLDAMYRQQLDDRDKRIEALAGSANIWMERYTQLQALVRALVCTRTYTVDGEYIRTRGGSVLYACSSSISAERLGALLAYRATLPATPTERGENHSGDNTDMVQKGGGGGE